MEKPIRWIIPPLGARRGGIFCEDLLDFYRTTGNPLHLWVAIRWCHRQKLPLPSAIMAYLDEVATELCDGVGKVKSTHASAHICKALRMTPRVFQDAKRDARNHALAVRADTEPKGGQLPLAKEKGISPGELSKRTKQFRGRW